MADLLLVEAEAGSAGGDPLPVGLLVVFTEREVEAQIALALQQQAARMSSVRGWCRAVAPAAAPSARPAGEESGDEGLLRLLGGAMGLCQQLAESGPDEGHLVELGTLVVTGAGGGDEGHETLQLGVAQELAAWQKGKAMGWGKRLRWLT